MPGSRVSLNLGALIRFGSSDASWEILSDAAPEVVAVEVEGNEVLEGEHGLISWTSDQLLLTENGSEYWLEVNRERTPVIDRQIVEVSGRRFRISIPSPEGPTGPTITAEGFLFPHEVTLRFVVSRDEENVAVFIVANGVHKALRSRSFDFMLLSLARARIADARSKSMPANEQGWVYSDRLAAQLEMDVSHVNVDVYRARKRFAEAGIQDADEMLQRRSHARALRLGCLQVEIK